MLKKLLLCSLLIVSTRSAYGLTPYQFELQGQIKPLLQQSSTSAKIRIKIRTHEGIFNATLNRRNFRSQHTSDTNRYFTGKLKTKHGQRQRPIPRTIAISVLQDELRLTLFGRTRARSYAGFAKLHQLLEGALLRGKMSHLPSVFPVPCGLSQAQHSHTVASVAQQFSASALVSPAKEVRLITETDNSFFTAEGADVSGVNAEVLSTINSVNSIWENQIGVSFDVVAQYNQTDSGADPYTSTTDSGDLLLKFLCNRNPLASDSFIQTECSGLPLGNTFSESADLYHLFTGQTMQSSVIGLAYVGVVCQSSNAFSFGLTAGEGLVSDALKYLITAHEIGHNFNAQHVSETSVMSSTFTGSTSFSSASTSTISAFADSEATCLADAEPSIDPTLSLTSVKYSKSSKRVRLGLTITNNDPSSSVCSVVIYSGKTAGTATDKQHGVKSVACPYGTPTTVQIQSKALSLSNGSSAKSRYFQLRAGDSDSEARKLKIYTSSSTKLSTLVSALNKGFPN